MHSVSIPILSFDFKTKVESGVQMIWDICRKKFVQITPEEMVRQYLIHYFMEVMHYPKGLIAVEKEIRLGKLKKRFDIVVFERDLTPFLLVECKEPNVPLNDSVLMQTLNYLNQIQSKYIMISNGILHFVGQRTNNNIEWLDHLPIYNH